MGACCEQQRVFVGVDGAKAEEHQVGGDGEKGGQFATATGGLEFEVLKTELCNKWS